MGINIEKNVVGDLRTNSYLVYDDNKIGFLIDPSFDIEEILESIKEKKLEIQYILLTHGHFDHIYMVNEIKEMLGKQCKVLININAKEVLKDKNQNLIEHFMLEDKEICVDEYLNDGDIVSCGDFIIKHIHIGGHTIDSSCYYVDNFNVVFSGDTLFYESIGRTDLYKSDTKLEKENIVKKLFKLDDDVEVFPGHGKETTIGHEKNNNRYLNNI